MFSFARQLIPPFFTPAGRFSNWMRLSAVVFVLLLLWPGSSKATEICKCSPTEVTDSCKKACGEGGGPIVIIFPESPKPGNIPNPLMTGPDWKSALMDDFTASELEQVRTNLEALRIDLEQSREEFELRRNQGVMSFGEYQNWMGEYRGAIENYQLGIDAYREKFPDSQDGFQ